MNRAEDLLNPTQADQFGQASAALLHQGSQVLPASIKDRLYAARMKALSVRKPEKVRIQKHVLVSTSGNWSFGSSPVWDAFSWVAPLIVLVFGLIGIAQWQEGSRIDDIAAVDAAILVDDVPPDAYADSGFMGFLKNGGVADSQSDSASSIQSK